MIPKSFQCMGSTITVTVEPIPAPEDEIIHGKYKNNRITIAPNQNQELMRQTFWHEFMHCALGHLGYTKLDSKEQFVDQMASLLFQLEKTKKGRADEKQSV